MNLSTSSCVSLVEFMHNNKVVDQLKHLSTSYSLKKERKLGRFISATAES
jgi:hypothetical protein